MVQKLLVDYLAHIQGESMTSSVHGDWLQRFKDDLRTGDVESLTGNVETAGLEIILDSEFYELACQEDARQVVILIGTLMFRNSLCNIPYYNHLDVHIGRSGSHCFDWSGWRCLLSRR